MKGARVQTAIEYTSSSCVWKNQIAYILCVSRRVHWYALPPCTLWKALASDTNPVPPLAEFCVPCVPSGTGPHSQAVPQNRARPPVRPQEAPCGRFPPQVGERTRPRPVRGRFGPHRGEFRRKKRKPPGPESSRQRRWANTSAFGFPLGEWFPQKPAVVRGVKKEQVKGPGSPTGVPCRVTSPGRAGR